MIRCDFVSNSSSCNYIITTDKPEKELFEHLCTLCSQPRKDEDVVEGWDEFEFLQCLKIRNGHRLKCNSNNISLFWDPLDVDGAFSYDPDFIATMVKDGKIVDEKRALTFYSKFCKDFLKDFDGKEIPNNYYRIGKFTKDSFVLMDFIRDYITKRTDLKQVLIEGYKKQYDIFVNRCHNDEEKEKERLNNRIANVDNVITGLNNKYNSIKQLVMDGKSVYSIRINNNGDGEDEDSIFRWSDYEDFDDSIVTVLDSEGY